MSGHILVVDDDRDTCDLVQRALQKRGFDVDTALDGESARELFQENDYDTVVADVNLPGESGLDLCDYLAERRPDVPVVIVTGHGDMDVAVEAIRAGAYDFVTKPLAMDHLFISLQRAIRHRQLGDELRRLREVASSGSVDDFLIGESRPMRRVYDVIRQVADTDATVLVCGESGTGKELVAKAIHKNGARRDKPFIAINCAAMPAELLESELFGHVKGAFTGALRTRQGLFVQADGGTLFLDEIGEMAAEMQAKLLRVLQERRARPVGGDAEIPFNTRIIAATNRDLDAEVEEGRFREDLYYRINVVRVEVPPLRSRGRDVLILAQQFLDEAAARSDKEVTGISAPAAKKLLDYDWPGNVRELQNCIERAVTLTSFNEVTVDDLPAVVATHESQRLVIAGDDPEQMPTLEEMERRYIRRVLDAVQWNKSQGARVLGIDRRTLYRKLDRLEISDPE